MISELHFNTKYKLLDTKLGVSVFSLLNKATFEVQKKNWEVVPCNDGKSRSTKNLLVLSSILLAFVRPCFLT